MQSLEQVWYVQKRTDKQSRAPKVAHAFVRLRYHAERLVWVVRMGADAKPGKCSQIHIDENGALDVGEEADTNKQRRVGALGGLGKACDT